jgi:flagellar basal-body rod modification protein FlgD
VIVDGTSSATGDSRATTGAPLRGTKDEFLRLFMAQLQHQDPFAPTSGADMVAQLAQLSSVEQAAQTNSRLGELAAQQASAASAGLATLVGRQCTAAAGQFALAGDGAPPPPPLAIHSASPCKSAALVIRGADGNELRRIAIPDGTTSTTISWDGCDAGGRKLPPGNYEIAVDGGATISTPTAQWSGRVDAVELTAAGPRLRMAGVVLSPGDIRAIAGTLDNQPQSKHGAP